MSLRGGKLKRILSFKMVRFVCFKDYRCVLLLAVIIASAIIGSAGTLIISHKRTISNNEHDVDKNPQPNLNEDKSKLNNGKKIQLDQYGGHYVDENTDYKTPLISSYDDESFYYETYNFSFSPVSEDKLCKNASYLYSQTSLADYNEDLEEISFRHYIHVYLHFRGSAYPLSSDKPYEWVREFNTCKGKERGPEYDNFIEYFKSYGGNGPYHYMNISNDKFLPDIKCKLELDNLMDDDFFFKERNFNYLHYTCDMWKFPYIVNRFITYYNDLLNRRPKENYFRAQLYLIMWGFARSMGLKKCDRMISPYSECLNLINSQLSRWKYKNFLPLPDFNWLMKDIYYFIK